MNIEDTFYHDEPQGCTLSFEDLIMERIKRVEDFRLSLGEEYAATDCESEKKEIMFLIVQQRLRMNMLECLLLSNLNQSLN